MNHSYTHNEIGLSTILGVAKEENIGGIKNSPGDFVFFSRGCSTRMLDTFPGFKVRIIWLDLF